MPDIAKVFKEEIQRLARKEVKAALTNLRKDNVALKRTLADQKRRIAKLERNARQLLASAATRRKELLKVAGDDVDKARVTAKMVRSLRARLRLSQAELAKLLDVNPQTIYQWEHKEGRLVFRGGVKARIVVVRKLKAREARQQLEQLAEKTAKKPRKRRAKRG